MKKLLFFFILLSPYFTIAQIITTIAGNSIPGYNGDGGLATVANMQAPYQAVSDAVGNVYIADTYNNVIRKISATGIISTFAGTGASGYGGDGGPASAANFNYPISLTFDAAGNLYVADHGNSRIRKISTSGIITTFAGNGSDSHSGDGGPATAASFGSISAICFDAIGNMIMSEYNCYIRKISSTGIITTIAGTGPFGGYSGDGG
ncbi:MAG: hypothetical protein K9G49_09280, partial [Taibaiella sp.]|nr:hypothetical protein [Taibaiella sp.]